MRNYEERAKDFIKQIFPMIEKCNDIWEFREAIRKFNHTYSRKVNCTNGVARIALVTSDYVVKFEYDSDEVDRVGGCENEILMYQIAEEEGFAYLFAKITRYEYSGRRFYIMPRIEGVGRNRWNYADKYMTDEEKEFCERHQIYDLHSKNYGFRNRHVCIIDYACVDAWVDTTRTGN